MHQLIAPVHEVSRQKLDSHPRSANQANWGPRPPNRCQPVQRHASIFAWQFPKQHILTVDCELIRVARRLWPGRTLHIWRLASIKTVPMPGSWPVKQLLDLRPIAAKRREGKKKKKKKTRNGWLRPKSRKIPPGCPLGTCRKTLIKCSGIFTLKTKGHWYVHSNKMRGKKTREKKQLAKHKRKVFRHRAASTKPTLLLGPKGIHERFNRSERHVR